MSIILSDRLRMTTPGNYMHYCDGCRSRHLIPTSESNANGAIWTYNGNPFQPTFSPSIHISAGPYDEDDGTIIPRKTTCHYFITNGMIEYLGDCDHHLAGKTVPLPTFPSSS